MKPRYECTHCGRDEITAMREGCGEPEPRYVTFPRQRSDGAVSMDTVRVRSCPMAFRRGSLRWFLDKFGILLP